MTTIGLDGSQIHSIHTMNSSPKIGKKAGIRKSEPFIYNPFPEDRAMNFPDHPFWDFSLRVHEHPGVHEACLELQVKHALDVNILFFCCWAGSMTGNPLGRSTIERAMDAVAGWQEEIVRPVWEARHRLKPRFSGFPTTMTEPLRKALISAELDAEHIEQLHLSCMIPVKKKRATLHSQAKHSVRNMADYLALFFSSGKTSQPSNQEQTVIPDDLKSPLSILLSACFPELERDLITDLLIENLTSQ